MTDEKQLPPDQDENLRRDTLALLSVQMQTHERYHTQKETMTWLVSLAYIGAAIVLVGREPFWRDWPIHWFLVWVALLLLTASSIIYFVHWQFQNRNRASAFFTCSADVAAQCLHAALTVKDLTPVPLRQLNNMLVPVAVERRFNEQFTGEFSWPQRLTMILSVLWTIAGGVYLLLTYPGLCNS